MSTLLRPRRLLAAILVCLAYCAPMPALGSLPAELATPSNAPAPQDVASPTAEAKFDPLAALRTLGAFLTPDDLRELSLYLRDVAIDVLRGTQDAALPPDLAFKLAVLERRLRKHGDVYLQQAIRNLDRDLRRFLQGLPVPIQLPELRADNGQ